MGARDDAPDAEGLHQFPPDGERSIDRGGASLTLLFDANTLDWSDSMVARMGLRRDILPRLSNSTDVLGAVTAAAAADTGLPEGLPVVLRHR